MRLTLAIVVASGAVASASMLGGGGGGGGGDVGASAAPAKGSSHLRVHGKVRGLYPGAEKKLRVHVRNTAERQMWVKAVGTAVGDASSSCTSDYLYVKQKNQRHRRVPPSSHRMIKLRVRLASAAPDACQGVKWPLDYTVRVKRR